MRRAMLQQLNRKNIFLLFLVGMILCFSAGACTIDAAEKAVDKTPYLHVTYGIEQQARYGREAVFSLEAGNVSEEGRYELQLYLGNRWNHNVKYTKELMLSPNHAGVVEFFIPMYQEYTGMRVALVNAKGTTIVEEETPFRVMNYGTNKVIGILSGKEQGYDYLKAFGSQCTYLNKDNFPSNKSGLDMIDILLIEDFNCNELDEQQQLALTDFLRAGGMVAVGGINQEKVLDTFVANGLLSMVKAESQTKNETQEEDLQKENNETLKENQKQDNDEKLKENQKQDNDETLKEYEQQDNDEKLTFGEREIILGDQEQYQQLLLDINSYEADRRRLIESLAEAEKTYGQVLEQSYYGDSMLENVSVSQLRWEAIKRQVSYMPVQGASILHSIGSIPILQKVKIDQGQLLLFGFELAATEPKENATLLEIARLLQTNLSGAYLQRLELERYGNVDTLYDAEVLKYSDRIERPFLWKYLFVLFLYVFLIGPVLFIVLRHYKKSKYLWGLVPLLAIIFMYLMIIIGQESRITEPFVSYFNVERYEEETGTIQGKASYLLSFAMRKKQELLLSDAKRTIAGEVSFPSYISYYNEDSVLAAHYMDLSRHPLSFSINDTATIVKSNQTPAFAQNYMESDYQYKTKPLIQAKVTVQEDQIQGTITNISTRTLPYAFFYCNGVLFSLNNLNPQDSVSLEDAASECIMNVEGIYYSKLINELLAYDGEEQLIPATQRYHQALSNLITTLQKEGDGAYLISFPREVSEENPIASIAHNKGSFGTNALIIPVQTDHFDRGKTFVVDIDDAMELTKTTYEYLLYYRYMLSDELVVQYHFPKEDNIQEFVVSRLYNCGTKDSTDFMLAQNIYFYNNTTKQFDLMFALDKFEQQDTQPNAVVKQAQGSNLADYLTKDNGLKVKYENQRESDQISTVPRISYLKEADDASN